MIRKFEKQEDLDRIMEIWLESNIEAHSFIDKSYWERNYDLVKKLLPTADIYEYVIDGEIVGFIGVADKSYIAGIFIDIRYRSKGIGKELIDYCKDIYDILKLDVYENNYKAVSFYKRNNFKIEKKTLEKDSNAYEYHMKWES